MHASSPSRSEPIGCVAFCVSSMSENPKRSRVVFELRTGAAPGCGSTACKLREPRCGKPFVSVVVLRAAACLRVGWRVRRST